MPSPTRKQALVAELIQRLTEALDGAQRSHRAAIEGATHEQAKPENDKDTRGLEQSYLARGQALRIAEQTAQLATVNALQLRALPGDAPIDIGALVTLEEGDRTQSYLILPYGGGLVLEGGAVQVVTPAAPICRAMIGKQVGDETVLSIGGRRRELVVVAVE
jgi:transcription elongation GreA/GreB family factor